MHAIGVYTASVVSV